MRTTVRVRAMSAAACVSALIISISLLSAHSHGQTAESQPGPTTTAKPTWIEGTGKDLRIRVGGEVLDESGTPVNDCKVVAQISPRYPTTDIPVVVERNRFHVWVPAGQLRWFNLQLTASSADGQQFAAEVIPAFQLRQAAIEGVKLTIKAPERTVVVNVVYNGMPVADATVRAEINGLERTTTTDGMGIARIPMHNHEKLNQLTAWTNDFRIGGYLFSREPYHDPAGSEFTVELDSCRPQVVRIINAEDNTPVPDLEFVLIVGTGAPNYQYPGSTPGCEMKTNDKGEAIYRWFPDWKTHGSYVESRDPRWIEVSSEDVSDGVVEPSDGAILFRVKKSRLEERKHVVGKVVLPEGSPAGFRVEMSSFQVADDQVAGLYCFTDENGNFAGEYGPGSTYWINVNDARYVSDIIDLIPYEPAGDKTNVPTLAISKGEPVEVTFTFGPANTPVAYQWISLETPHHFTWLEDGKKRGGNGGRRWWVTTDQHGKARTFALPGRKIEGSAHRNEWSLELSTEVKAGGATRLDFHRAVTDKRKIVGRLLIDGEVQADLGNAVIEIGSADGETKERLTCRTNERGEFEFESAASRLAFFARTQDAKAAAVTIIDQLDQPLELHLKPTGEYLGQLLGKDDVPVAGHAVHATLSISGKPNRDKRFRMNFLTTTFDAKTDSAGNYSLPGLPCEVTLEHSTDPVEGITSNTYLADFDLVPNESRPRTIHRPFTPTIKVPFAERYAEVLRDCRLSDYHAMVILSRPSDEVRQFVNTNFIDYETTKEIVAYMQMVRVIDDQSPDPEVVEFARSRNWPIPETGHVLAIALDSTGRELGRLDVDSKDTAAAKQASDFIRKHVPVKRDAITRWNEAFAEASRSGRKVWVRVSGRYCQPCFLMTRWLDDQKEILEKDYVFLKLDDILDPYTMDVIKRLEGSDRNGIPFHVIFDADEKPMITSEGPQGNIGHPSGLEGTRHMRKMLQETRKKLSDNEIDALIKSLRE